ncbi:MAG: DEAD/DEAH box helicase [Desulfuromonadales bacterium]
MTEPPAITPSPLLKRFKEYQPGDMYNFAAKVHLISAFEACKANTVTGASWNKDKTALVVTFIGGCQATLIAEGWRLLATCTCRLWQPARNCPHIVIAWATLKRIVSPETLSHMLINQQMLLDMRRYLEQEPVARNTSRKVKQSVTAGKLKVKQEASGAGTPKYRLLIEQSGQGNYIHGAVKHGNETVYGWTSHGLPTDLARFLATNYSYDSSERYFKMFRQMTGDAYPIIFRDTNGHETKLVYQEDQPCIAGVTLDIRGDEVHISRSLAGGIPLSSGVVTHGQLLFDISAGVIMPVANRDAWKSWEVIIDELDGSKDDVEEWGEEEDESIQEAEAVNPELRRQWHTVIAPLELINSSVIRFLPEAINNPKAHCYFQLNGISLAQSPVSTLAYLLEIPRGLNAPITTMMPAGRFEHVTIPFFHASFRLFNPYHRTDLSGPMRARKRIRAVLDAAFTLLDETRSTARNTIIRSATSSTDFLKREVKREAKQLISNLAEAWDQSMIIAMATPDGWRFLKDDHRSEARLMRILYDLFGLDHFVNCSVPVTVPITLELETDRFLLKLPNLMERLTTEGFTLRIGSEPLMTASWAFSLDATRSSQDWFELKPEIICNGELLTEEELHGLLEGGMLRRDGKLMMLDEISAQVLAMFAGAMPSGKKKKKGEREPVRVPRLQILDWLHLRSHGVTVRLSADDARILESLLNFSSIPARPLPGGLNATLRHYQVDAWHWLAFLYEHRFGACLADDMGLGKTLQGITLLAGIMSGEIASAAAPGTPHLVVAPPSLLFNWEAEIARFLPSARVMLYSGGGRSTDEFSNHDVIITSYGIVQRDSELLAEQCFNVLIFDETQVVKNLQAATTNAVRKLNGSFTLALTGTPVENHLGEYYAIMDLCLPGLLGTREEFSRKLRQDNIAGTARLIGRTRPFVLRRTKQLIASELPPKIEMDIPLELTTKQRAFYQRTVEEVRGNVREAYASHAPAQARIIALTAILRLRQICLAPALASPGASDASPKLEFLAEQLAELRDEGHSALVFSQFTGYLDLIEKALREQGFSCLRLDGSTPVPQRKKLVQTFQNGVEPSVFLISLKAGGKGLNLTRATYVYHMDPWWNPAVENQASDRAHRIGQTGQVTIIRLIMRHTIEEKMMALKVQKLQLYKAILEEGTGGGGAGLTREDFDFLLG